MIAALLQFIDGLCITWQSVQQSRDTQAFQGRGTTIPEAQIAAALSGQEPVPIWPEFLAQFQQLRAQLEEGEGVLSQLCRRLQPSDFQLFCLILAIAPQWNRKYERIFAFLQDNINLPFATLGLAADLFGLMTELGEKELFAVNQEQHPLNRFLLVPKDDGLARPLLLRPTTLTALVGGRSLPSSLSLCCNLYWEETPPVLAVRQPEGAEVLRFVQACQYSQRSRTSLLGLYGMEGSGRRYLLRHAAASLGIPLLCLDCRHLSTLSQEERQEVLSDFRGWCWVNGALPALCHFDFPLLNQADREALTLWLLGQMSALPLTALCGEAPLKLRIDANLFQLDLEGCSISEQRQLWSHALQSLSLPLAEGVDELSLANVYALSPGQIQQALSDGENHCLAKGETAISREAITLGVRQICRPKMRQLADPIQPSFTWDDLMLEQSQIDLLQQMCDRIRYRWKVNEDWGFNRKIPYGRGVSVCLYGPPGTGKTMTAQVLAREFGLDAYRVDMSRIMDKYIGETEKKLAELFDAARDSNAILFFDEADVLFAKRSQVNDSKDKYANAETAYLLQRMEQHAGVSILATNAAQNFDEAFKRRISFMINIPMPSEETRKRLWQSVFPESAPLVGIDFDFFAQRFDLSGSSIKNVAVAAAFRAASLDCPINRELLSQAVRDEYLKTGRVLMEHQLY